MSYIVSYYFTKNNGHATGFGHAKYPEYLGFESLLKNIRYETGNDDVVILNIVEEPIKKSLQPIGLKDKNGVDVCIGNKVILDGQYGIVSLQSNVEKEHFLQYGVMFIGDTPILSQGFHSFEEIADYLGLDDLEVIE